MFRLVRFYDNVIVILRFILRLVFISIVFIFSAKSLDRFFVQENLIEVVWTLAPAVILVFIAVPSLHVLYIIEDIYKMNLAVKRVGHQWYWRYEYRDFEKLEFDRYMVDRSFRLLETDNSLVLPVNSYVYILLTSADVIHSWSVNSLGLKRDCVPGRINQLLFMCRRSGVFFGQCSEICGANHRFIPIKVEFLPLSYFRRWLVSNI